ncbi:MAG: hypothetical protein LBB74_03260 [Chitinispirillales bacterium]|jgi:signal peptidase I|nr:hypothetical protein [Chitinispirillales bacterium]
MRYPDTASAKNTGAAITAAFWILTTAYVALCAMPAKTFVGASHPAVRHIGRFDRRHPQYVRFDWPGVAVETRFEGASCDILLRGDGGLYDVSVDGVLTVRRFDTLETAHTLASGLADSIHSLRIVKRTEGLRGQVVTFKGFYVDAGKSLLPPVGTVPARRVEFIGGSNLLGFGVEADTVWCDTPYNYSNVSLSFGAVAAREVGAEYRVLAVSGKGLVRNWRSPYIAATRPFEPLYRLAVKNDPSSVWNFKSWVPQVVAICFGTNDFSTYPYPTRTLFVESYKKFLDGVTARYPGVQIVCVTSAREPVRTYVREMVEQEREEGNERIHFYSFGEVPKRQCGCDWHPNAGAQEKIGRELAKVIGPLFGD